MVYFTTTKGIFLELILIKSLDKKEISLDFFEPKFFFLFIVKTLRIGFLLNNFYGYNLQFRKVFSFERIYLFLSQPKCGKSRLKPAGLIIPAETKKHFFTFRKR